MKTKQPEVESVREFLASYGWRQVSPGETSTGGEYWYKQFKHAPRCKCNDENEGIQAVVFFHKLSGHFGHSYSVEIAAEKPDGVWVKLSAYGIGPEIREILGAQVAQLLAAWTAMAGFDKE